MDYDDAQIVFPAIICATDNRPDVVIWSKESKRVIIIELTVPAEENIANAHHRKTVKYEALIAPLVYLRLGKQLFSLLKLVAKVSLVSLL